MHLEFNTMKLVAFIITNCQELANQTVKRLCTHKSHRFCNEFDNSPKDKIITIATVKTVTGDYFDLSARFSVGL